MSLKLRVHYKYRAFLNFFLALKLPSWLTSTSSRLIVGVALVAVVAAYVMQVSNATSGYRLQNLETQTAVLQKNIQDLQTEVAANQSMPSIQNRLAGANLVSAPSIQYISVDTAMAKR